MLKRRQQELPCADDVAPLMVSGVPPRGISCHEARVAERCQTRENFRVKCAVYAESIFQACSFRDNGSRMKPKQIW